MKVSQVFKQAKRYLWNGKQGWMHKGETAYICHAINTAAYKNGFHDEDSWQYAPYKRAKRIIQQRIDPYHELGDWVRKNVKGSYKTLNKINAHEQMQAYRHRWLDALIKEFEAMGE